MAQILTLLEKAGSVPVSGEEIGRTAGVSRTMAWKYIRTLRQRGYAIEAMQGKGYVLRGMPDKLYPERISVGLDTNLIGREILYYKKTGSTNDVAKKAGNEAPDGTVIIAETQEYGRGRRGCNWISPSGGIWLSVILKPQISPARASRLTLVAGVAVAETLRREGIDADLKWPNDVLVKGKKICGILTEMEAETDSISYVVIGIGINANMETDSLSEETRERATTMKAELGKEIDRVDFIHSLLRELEQQYIRFNTRPFGEILSDWTAFSDTIGRNVKVVTPAKTYEGKTTGIADDGALLIDTGKGQVEAITYGRCFYV
jgi:BirA family biotin operon repressor/biotin-[acetyl-CoA-carboxylase] ligase